MTRDCDAGIVDRQDGVANLEIGNGFRAPFDPFVEEARVLAVEESDCRGVGGSMSGEQPLRLLLKGGERRSERNGLHGAMP
jgi:hypothetical protein